jgi:hypothetical protein
MVIIKYNLRILRGIKCKKILDHDFAVAQPLSKSSGDQGYGSTAPTRWRKTLTAD